ncbi:MAG: 5-formyltetrahydrofolate cyclo-ligase [Limisphaerales bacterium]
MAQNDRPAKNVNIAEEKQALRTLVKSAVAKLSSPDRSAASNSICKRVIQSAEWAEAGSILLFSPLPDEPDISDLLASGLATDKIVCLPRYLSESGRYEAAIIKTAESDLLQGKYGILEPSHQCAHLALNQLDLMLVPGVAFAPGGARLGRGKGYYDRILKSVPARKIGIAFDEQITTHVPAEEHDQPVDAICTPQNWIEAD